MVGCVEMEMSGEEMIAFATDIYNKKFANCGADKEDMIMEGVSGILTYKDRYDEEQGKFTSYIWKCAFGFMMAFYLKYINNSNKCVLVEDIDIYGSGSEDIDNYGVCNVSELKRINNETSENELRHNIINDLLEDYRQIDVAKKNRVSRQYVSAVWSDYCENVRGEYNFINGDMVLKNGSGE